MGQQKFLRNQKGLTLIEIIAVMVILGVLSAIVVPRYIDLEQSANQRVIDAAIMELNAREVMVWMSQKNSADGYQNDAELMGIVDYNLGTDYSWNPGHPLAAGGDLTFKEDTVVLNRMQSGLFKPGVWSHKTPLNKERGKWRKRQL